MLPVLQIGPLAIQTFGLGTSFEPLEWSLACRKICK